MNAFRENIEGMASKNIELTLTGAWNNLFLKDQRNDISQYADNKLVDLNIMQKDYSKSGGTDPKILEGMQNI